MGKPAGDHSVFKAVILHKLTHASWMFFSYLTESHMSMLKQVLNKTNRRGFTLYDCHRELPR